MSKHVKSSENSEGDALNILQKMSHQGIDVNGLVKDMDPELVKKFLLTQYDFLSEKYKSLEEQLQQLKEIIKSDGRDTSARIERILMLMTSNMSFIKKLIDLESDHEDKFKEQEGVNSKNELKFSSLIERQNKLITSLNNLNENTKVILDEIAQLKTKVAKHDAFQVKLISIASISASIFAWLMTGDHLTKIIVFIKSLSGNS